MRIRWHVVLVILLACWPVLGEAQIIRKIKDHATKKVDDRKKATDSTIVHATDTAVDTTLNRAESALSTGLKHLARGGDDNRIATELANGRVSLPELRFVEGTDKLDSAAAPILRQVAAALGRVQGNYLVEGHGAGSGDPADLSLSQARAVAVKTALLALGVPVERLFAMGFGAAAKPNGIGNAVARIEIARMQ